MIFTPPFSHLLPDFSQLCYLHIHDVTRSILTQSLNEHEFLGLHGVILEFCGQWLHIIVVIIQKSLIIFVQLLSWNYLEISLALHQRFDPFMSWVENQIRIVGMSEHILFLNAHIIRVRRWFNHNNSARVQRKSHITDGISRVIDNKIELPLTREDLPIKTLV